MDQSPPFRSIRTFQHSQRATLATQKTNNIHGQLDGRMKRLLDLIKNKIFLGLLGVIALGLVIWFGADFVKFGEDNATLSTTVRLILILGVLLIWLVIQMIGMFLSQRKNSGMLTALQESQINPDEEKRDQ